MCRRQIINAGLEKVVIRRTPTEFEVVPVQDWITEDNMELQDLQETIRALKKK